MKLIGIVFILFSAISVGSKISCGLKQQCGYLRNILDVLQVFEHEVAVRCTPLPETFSVMASMAQGNIKRVLLGVSEQMQQQRWTSPRSAMEHALIEFPDDLVGEIFLDLSNKIGRYDLDTQLAEIALAKEKTKQVLTHLEEERRMKSKTYKTLSICAGLAVVILLI